MAHSPEEPEKMLLLRPDDGSTVQCQGVRCSALRLVALYPLVLQHDLTPAVRRNSCAKPRTWATCKKEHSVFHRNLPWDTAFPLGRGLSSYIPVPLWNWKPWFCQILYQFLPAGPAASPSVQKNYTCSIRHCVLRVTWQLTHNEIVTEE